MKGKTDSPICHKPSTRFAEVQPHTPIIYKPLCGSQTDLSECLQASYTLCGRQNGLSGLCKPHTRFAEVKTDSLIFYKPPTRFAEVKMVLTELLQASYMLCSSQNLPGFANLQAWFRLWKVTLWTSTSLLHALRKTIRSLRSSTNLHALRRQKWLSNLRQTYYTLCGDKMYSPTFYKPPKRFDEV